MNTQQPPIPRRDEERYILAGVPPDGWNPEIPRQSESSSENLLDPPRPVP